MLALIAAGVFALALLLDFLDAHVGDAFTPMTLLFLGLLLIALYLAGVGGDWRGRGRWGRRDRG